MDEIVDIRRTIEIMELVLRDLLIFGLAVIVFLTLREIKAGRQFNILWVSLTAVFAVLMFVLLP